MATKPRPTPDEDAALRRLTWFEQELGARLAPHLQQVKQDIREKDRRTEVRPPEDSVEVVKAPDVVLMRVRGGRP